jgi:hypothetical protein
VTALELTPILTTAIVSRPPPQPPMPAPDRAAVARLGSTPPAAAGDLQIETGRPHLDREDTEVTAPALVESRADWDHTVGTYRSIDKLRREWIQMRTRPTRRCVNSRLRQPRRQWPICQWDDDGWFVRQQRLVP